MTLQGDELVEVTQADREMAWPFARFHCYPDEQMKERWFSGHYDKGGPLHPEGNILQAFARHRIASERAVRKAVFYEAAKVALDVATCGGVGERSFERIIGEDIAQTLRSLGDEGRGL